MKKLSALAFASVSVLSLSTPVFAQEGNAAPKAAAEEEESGEIVVTGTLIRGVAPTGVQAININPETLSAKAAGSTNELLSLVPQISNTFNGRFEGDPRGIAAGISITKPNLRSLPGFNSSSGGTTLVTLDGFRFAPVGVNQSAVDVDIIPGAVLGGIEVVTGGGSSLYGADAVSGVINFSSLKKFDGVKIDANYGFGTTIKGHKQWDGQITAGTSWSTGNAYISGGYSHRNLVLNNETDWATGEIYNAAGTPRFVGTFCNSAVGTETRWFHFRPGQGNWTNNSAAPGAGTFAVGTACDNVGKNTYSPQLERYNVFAAVTNDFSDSVSLRMTGYYTKRDTTLGKFPRGFTSAGSGITTGAQVGSLFGDPAVGTVVAITEGTGFSFAPNSAYVNTPDRVGFETWGVTPELTVKLGSNWQVRTTAHFGRSSNYSSFPGVDSVKAQCYITGTISGSTAPCLAVGITAGGQLNPLNAAAASAGVIQNITNYTSAQDTKQQLFVVRSVADGTIFNIADREAKLAVGVEYQDNKAESRLNAGAFGSLDSLPFKSYSRHSKSAFAELAVPVADFLDLTASVRWDDYSDFGSTTNPNVGLTFKPTNWLKLYGHWNKSFNAPTAVDGLGIATGRFACGIYVPGLGSASRPNDPAPAQDNGQGTCAMILDGVKAGISPQTAESWAVGFDITPTKGMSFGGEFYSIDFTNVLGAVDPSNLNTYLTNPDLYIYAVTAPQYATILSQLTNGTALGGQRASSDIALIVDRRSSNFGSAKLEGVDFRFNYATDTDLGRVSMGLNGTYQLKSIQNFGVRADVRGLGGPKLTASANFGLKTGGFNSRMTINYSGRFADSGTIYTGASRWPVRSFVTANLSLGYDFGESAGALSGTSLRFNIDNLANEKPQRIARGAANIQTYNNWTMGRVMKVGFSKKF